MNRLIYHCRIMVSLWKNNINTALEFRISFLLQIIGLIINNAIFFVFWILFFDKFPHVGGYRLEDMMLLFAIVSIGNGLALVFFGNALQLGNDIAGGRLDYFMVYPTNLLSHIISSKTILAALGDLIFGIILLVYAGDLSILYFAKVIGVSIMVAIIMVSFSIVTGSLSFWLGNTQTLADFSFSSLVMFSTYPRGIYNKVTNVLLMTVLPATFVGFIPVEILKGKEPILLLYLMLFTLFVALLGVWVFYKGLKKYESGNLININN